MKQTEIYGHKPRQMDDYGMCPEHYDSCNYRNGHEPEKTEEDETTDE